jgi:sugar O-acyltransferase (sialic acid O-acetyltransferase NeuD family)
MLEERKMYKLGIFGTGGFSLEVFDLIVDCFSASNRKIEDNVFFIDDNSKNRNHLGLKIIRQVDIEFEHSEFVIAISNSNIRKHIVDSLPKTAKFAKIIHPSSFISPSAFLGDDIIISHNCIVSSRVIIGNHSHLNYHTCIGHETEINEYFTAAPGVKISGKCKIGSNVYFGTNSALVEGKIISPDIKIGIGAVVMGNLKNPGTYLFNPAKKIF